jgi:hypothetical protein
MDDGLTTVAQYAELALSMTEAEFMGKVTRPVLIEKVGFFDQGHQSALAGTIIFRDSMEMSGGDDVQLFRAKVFIVKKKPGSMGTEIFVGRAPTNDIVLPNPSVSKSHAHFIPAPGTDHLQLVDMFSSNGTFLNGQKIHPFEKHQVKDYDEIRFGPEYLLVYFTPRIFYQMLKSIKS